jgi:hypothetical protein
MHAFSRNQITEANELNEYRMSNKEFRMIEFNHLRFFLWRSLFDIRPARYALKQIWDRSAMPMRAGATVAPQNTSQGRRAFCGWFLNFLAYSREVTA